MTTDTRWLSDNEQELWRLFLRATRKLNRGIDESLQADGVLSAAEFGVLASLSEAEGKELRVRELCEILEWDRSRASHQLTRMEKRGLIIKQQCVGDGRGILVSITNKGLERIEMAAPGHVESVRRLVFDHLGEEEEDALKNFLHGVINVDMAHVVAAHDNSARE